MIARTQRSGAWHDMNRFPDGNRLPRLLRYLTMIELAVLVVAGAGLFFLPGPAGDAWPWDLTPLNTRFLGAVYLAALVAVALLLIVDRWVPARTTLLALFGFTAIVFVISLVEYDRFEFDRPATWGWYLLYLVLPLNAAYHLWRYRPATNPEDSSPSSGWTALLHVVAATVAGYSIGLLLLPDLFTGFWPWPIDPFHGRLYSAAFASAAIGFYLAARSGRLLDYLSVGLTHLIMGVFAISGLLIVDADRDVINWSAAGTWLWVGGFGGLLALSIAMIVSARSVLALPVLRPDNPDRSTAVARAFALLFGSAFVTAGVTGFLPGFTSGPPTGATNLEITAAYGYLLGIYPVNAVHNLLHLGFGIAGFAAYFGRLSIGRYARVVAVILGALAVMGMVPGLRTTFGLLPVFGHDIWLHSLEALIAGYVGFVVTRTATPPSTAPTGEVARHSHHVTKLDITA